MEVKDKLWKWYRRHNYAIDAIIDIACDLVPGGKLILGAVKAANAMLTDQEGSEQKEQLDEVQSLLGDIKPVIGDIVEDIEDLQGFDSISSIKEARDFIQNNRNIEKELNKIMPRISQSLNQSISRLQPTKVLNNKYQLTRRIGGGGQGIIYRGKHLAADKPIAVKMLPEELADDPTAITELQREYGRLVDHLTHPNIVQYRDMDQDLESNRLFIVMDLIEGENLRELLLRHKRQAIALEDVVSILLPVAEALDFAHANHVIHCDLKPENILLRTGDRAVFLTDFGLAQEVRNTLSRKGSTSDDISGTLPYMAPEQYMGKPASSHTDVWALGVILYEMLCGYHPFQGTSFEHYMKLICDVEPDCPPNISSQQWQVLGKMLCKDRRERPTSAKESLLELSGQAPVKHPVVVPAQRTHNLSPVPSTETNLPAKNYISAANIERKRKRWLPKLPKIFSFRNFFLCFLLWWFICLCGIAGWFFGRYDFPPRQVIPFPLISLIMMFYFGSRILRWQRKTTRKLHVVILMVLWIASAVWMCTADVSKKYEGDINLEYREILEQYQDKSVKKIRPYLLNYDDVPEEKKESDEEKKLRLARKKQVAEHAEKLDKLFNALRNAGASIYSYKSSYYLKRYYKYGDEQEEQDGKQSKQDRYIAPGHKDYYYNDKFYEGKFLIQRQGDMWRIDNFFIYAQKDRLRVYEKQYGVDELYAWYAAFFITTFFMVFLLRYIVKRWRIFSKHNSQLHTVAFHPNGLLLASAGADITIKLWTLKRKKVQLSLTGHMARIHKVAFSPSGKMLVSACEDGEIRLWAVETGNLLGRLVGHQWPVYDIAFHPNGKILASAGGDRMVKLWDLETGHELHTFLDFQDEVYTVTFSPCGRVVAAAGAQAPIRLWEMNTYSSMATLEGHGEKTVDIVFGYDSDYLLASTGTDGLVKVWDWKRQQLLKTLDGAQGDLRTLAISPNGKMIVCGTSQELLAWDIESQKIWENFNNHDSGVQEVVFSPDGHILASAGGDCKVRLSAMVNLRRSRRKSSNK